MPPPTLYLFVGFPGAGKTTVAKLIEQQTGALHLWADQERQKMFDQVTHSQQESSQLYAHLNAVAEQALAEGKSVIFDTNFNYRKDRQHLGRIAQQHGAKVCIIWMITPKNVARERALHETHRDRNGYLVAMTEAEFEQLTDHLEPPTDNEKFITIEGTHIDRQAVIQQLSL